MTESGSEAFAGERIGAWPILRRSRRMGSSLVPFLVTVFQFLFSSFNFQSGSFSCPFSSFYFSSFNFQSLSVPFSNFYFLISSFKFSEWVFLLSLSLFLFSSFYFLVSIFRVGLSLVAFLFSIF